MSLIIERRLEQLESAHAHLERQYDELNRIVIAQGRLLDRLKAQQEVATHTLESIEMERVKANNAKPPHYQ